MPEGWDDKAPEGAHGEASHVSVLYNEAIEFLAVKAGGTYIDATVGAGGHSYGIASSLGARGRLIGFDKDPAALASARARLTPPPDASGGWPAIELRQGSFTR